MRARGRTRDAGFPAGGWPTGALAPERHAPVAAAAGERTRATLACLTVFGIGFAARMATVLTSRGGLIGRFVSYDTGVYYAAGDALSFGRLPYRDFTLLHPPGLPLALVPFAVLGRLTSDHVGYIVAAVAVMALGGINAALVTLVAHRMGSGWVAAVTGGLFYAIWLGAVHAEYLVRLEPLGNALILVGLLAYVGAERSGRSRGLVWAGAAFAAAASVKIWWAVPLVVLIAWQLSPSRRVRLRPVMAGAAGALLVIDGPFLLAAPSAMWHMVVTDQLSRTRSTASWGRRARYLISGHYLDSGGSRAAVDDLVVTAAVVLLIMMIAAWQRQAARLVLTVLLAQAAVLALAPSWFGFYADYLAPAVALTVAASISPFRWRHQLGGSRARTLGSVAGVLTVIVAATVTGRFLAAGNAFVVRYPSAALTSAASGVRCLMTDEPTGQILTDTLSRGLRDGCPNWIDITGRTYGPDKMVGPDGKRVWRIDNPRWQQDVRRYLTSGDAALLSRGWGAGESADTLRAIRGGGVLADVDGHIIYRTRH